MSPSRRAALLNAGADADLASPVSGDTPLMYAARMNSPQRIRMLLKHGANPDARNKQGKTAADLAKRIGAPHAYATLKRAAGKRPAG
ncbi:MAG: ankyrin repeat domain-containing protein [Caulobacter sp.]|nr:ankyrin repeat domain-containing protein [Caulobacter sp.]